MNKQPSLLKILANDYLAFLGVILPVAVWGVYLYLLLTQKLSPTDLSLPLVFLLLTVLGLMVLGWRVRAIQSFFSDALEANATISSVSFYRDRGRVEYAYLIQGQKYIAGSAIMKTKQTRALLPGAQVIVLVDRNNLKRAILRDLYL